MNMQNDTAPRFIGPEIEPRLSWLGLTDALIAGHKMPRAEVADSFLYRGPDTLLTRSAWIDGFGIAVKPATIFPHNADRGAPGVNGVVNLLTDRTGELEALVDFRLVTKWKTAGDSLLAARKLVRPDAKEVLIIGAGHVAENMIAAYRALIPDARITIWNRTIKTAEDLAQRVNAEVSDDLPKAVAKAELIATATMARDPILQGDWLSPGTHVDLIGSFRPGLREADDHALQRASLFVDNRNTTIAHVGEIQIPMESGAIREEDIIADFYDLETGRFARQSEDEITICKNGGGAHLDLMTARYILEAASAA